MAETLALGPQPQRETRSASAPQSVPLSDLRILARDVQVGAWLVQPCLDQIRRGEEIVRIEPRTMRLLLCFIARAGDVLSIQELLEQVWPRVRVTPDSVYQAVTTLRRLLGDDPRAPAYILTIPRRGYRLIAALDAALPGSTAATKA